MRILDASAGFSAPLTLQEAREFLTESKLNVHIATLDENGDPNIHPTWYYFDSSKDNTYIETSKDSKKAINLRKNNTVYFCVDDPNMPYKGVRGKGTVRIHEDIEYNIPITEKIMLRYLGSIEHPIAKTLIGYVKKGHAVLLEIIPSYFSTWDDSKISQARIDHELESLLISDIYLSAFYVKPMSSESFSDLIYFLMFTLSNYNFSISTIMIMPYLLVFGRQ